MRPLLLVSNDDGIDSPFLHPLVDALRPLGDVAVAAPRTEQSWIGKAVSRHRSVATGRAPGWDLPAWWVDGTPSDCVHIAIQHLLERRPAAVVSGINIGDNAGLPFIFSSGTIAAALEGALCGLPALAFSQHLGEADFESVKCAGKALPSHLADTVYASAKHAARMVGALLASPGPAAEVCPPVLVHNVNFPCPCRAETPTEATVPGRVEVPRLFARQEAEGDLFAFDFQWGVDLPCGRLTDRACLASGRISHSRLDYGALGRG